MSVAVHVSEISLESRSCCAVKTTTPEQRFSIKAVPFTGGQDKLKSLSKSEWQRQDRWWLEGVWGRRLECIIMHRAKGQQGPGRLPGPWSSPSSAGSMALWNLRPEWPGANPWRKLYTALLNPLTLWLSKSVRQRFRIHHAHTAQHTNTQMQGCDGSLQQALIKLCSWALLLLSPCDWCLASLALTNTDWSQTLNDFGPNLFKGSCQIFGFRVLQLNRESLERRNGVDVQRHRHK